MSCQTLSTALTSANVFQTRSQGLGPSITSLCNSLSLLDAFNQFCLVNVLNPGPVCDINAYSGDNNFLFNQMKDGNITTIPDLPILWQSATILNNNTSGNYVSTGLNGISTLTFPSLKYFIVSSGSPYIVFGLAVTGVTLNNSVSVVGSQVVLSWNDGFVRQAGIPATYQWFSTPPYLAVSPSGNILIADTWLWTSLQQSWQLQNFGFTEMFGAKIVAIGTYRFVIWYGATSTTNAKLIILRTTDASTVPLTPFVDRNFVIGTNVGYKPFLTVSTDQTTLFITSDNASNYVMWNLDIFTGTIPNPIPVVITNSNWNTFYGNITGVRGITATVVGSLGQQRFFTVANCYAPHAMNFTMTDTSFTFVNFVNNVSFVDSDVTGQFAGYSAQNTQLWLRQPGQTTYQQQTHIPFNIQPFTRPAFILGSPLSLSTVYIQNPTNLNLYRSLGNNTSWINTDVQLYSSLVTISDLGSSSLNVNDWNPPLTFYCGNYTHEVPKMVPLPYSLYSIHFRYQVTLTTAANNDPTLGNTTFKYINGATLNRSNDTFILTNASTIKLYNDANVQALDSSGKLIWQNGMHDGVNNNDNFIEWTNLDRPAVSGNGLYLTQISGGSFQMFYYPYNNELFTNFGQTNGTVFNNSIQAQTNFCFENLQTDPANPNNISFSDLNCACLGNSILFDRLFINVNLMPPSQAALLLDNMPCILLDCSIARVGSPPTNVVRLLRDKCKLPITICSVNIEQNDQSSLGSLAIVQDCNGGDMPIQCTNTDGCPAGSRCVNGFCSSACNIDADCLELGLPPNFQCIEGGCINTTPGGSGSSLSAGAIAGIVVGVVVVIVLVAVLCWYFLVKRKQSNKLNQTKTVSQSTLSTSQTTTPATKAPTPQATKQTSLKTAKQQTTKTTSASNESGKPTTKPTTPTKQTTNQVGQSTKPKTTATKNST